MRGSGSRVARTGFLLASLAVASVGSALGGDRSRAEAEPAAAVPGVASVEAGPLSPGVSRVAADTVVLEPARVIGRVAGDPDYLFGSITSVVADGEGRIYVGDRIGTTVRAYGADGEFLGRIAREGGGPGEIVQVPANLVYGVDGRLYVRDGPRITVFGPAADGRLADSVVATWSSPGAGNLTSSRSALARDGRYFYPGGRYPRGELPSYYLFSLTDGEPDGDTLYVPPYPGLARIRPALFPLGGDALMLDGLNRVPFSAVPVWNVTPDGTLLSSDGAVPVLFETDAAGDTLRVIPLPESGPRPISDGERADSLAALEARIAEAEELVARFGGRLDDALGVGDGVEERRLPESLPAVIGVHTAPDGAIWVERWPPEGESNARYYDVLEPGGALRGVVVLRAPLVRDPAPWFGERSVAGIVRDPETGVERVARFDLP